MFPVLRNKYYTANPPFTLDQQMTMQNQLAAGATEKILISEKKPVPNVSSNNLNNQKHSSSSRVRENAAYKEIMKHKAGAAKKGGGSIQPKHLMRRNSYRTLNNNI